MRLRLRTIVAFVAALVALGAAPSLSRADDITLTPRVIPVGKWAEGIAFANNALWVAESGQRDIAEIALNGSVLRRIAVGRLPVGMTVASDGAIYTLVETDKLLWQQFPTTAQGRAVAVLPGCPVAIASGGQYVWSVVEPDCSSATGAVAGYDIQTGAQRTSGPLNQWAQAAAVAQGKVWVAHAREPNLTVLDAATLAAKTADVQGAQLWSIGACCGEIHVGGQIGTNGSQGIIASIDPNTFQERRRLLVNQMIPVIAEDAKNVVAIGNKGAIWIFSQNGFEFQRLVTLTGGTFQPEAAIIVGDDLFISQQQRQGENGAILVVTGWRPAAQSVPSAPTAPLPAAPAAAPTPAAPTPSAPAPAAGPAPPATILSANCPFHVINVPDELGMYQNADTSAPKVAAIPAGARGLTADRCISGWCHVTFGNSTGWVQSQYLQPDCS